LATRRATARDEHVDAFAAVDQAEVTGNGCAGRERQAVAPDGAVEMGRWRGVEGISEGHLVQTRRWMEGGRPLAQPPYVFAGSGDDPVAGTRQVAHGQGS
jgi:hypothetical protein